MEALLHGGATKQDPRELWIADLQLDLRTRRAERAGTRRDDDPELQTEQTIVGLPPRKLQPDRMDARSWLGMTFAKESPVWCAIAAGRLRLILVFAARSAQGPPTRLTADARAWQWLRPSKAPEGKLDAGQGDEGGQ